MNNTKHCVGVLVYNDKYEILLIRNPKWKNGEIWMAPGGKIENGETEQDVVRREIKEEVGLEIEDLVKLGEQTKKAGDDFENKELSFHFYDWIAKAVNIKIVPEKREVIEWKWFSIKDALQLETTDSMQRFIQKYDEWLKTK